MLSLSHKMKRDKFFPEIVLIMEVLEKNAFVS
jgi:hypothetical protein